jgi:peptidyl-prolyl cis-trans isomerase D
MLRGMRKASSNWIGKTIMAVVMGVLIVSFGIWGIADAFKGYGQSKLATIGSTEITTEQFRQLYNDKLQQIGRQFGRPLTSDQARAFGSTARSCSRSSPKPPSTRTRVARDSVSATPR